MNTQQPTPDTDSETLSPLPVRLFRSFVLAVVLIALGASLGFCEEPASANGVRSKRVVNSWASTWAEAVEMSKETGKPIMLQFTGSDWCGWCQRLENEVFNQQVFYRWSDRVIKIRVDFPSNFQLPKHLQAQNDVLKDWYADFVPSYPTCLFVQPDGRVIGSIGYVDGGARNWIARAEGVLVKVGNMTAQVSYSR